jgi:catechol 2,3-dioxygenase-like lactoylglutathione lyase family enzyme
MHKPLVIAMTCMTMSTPDPENLIAFMTDGMGWEIRAAGPIDPAMEAAWGVAPGSAGDRFTLLASPGANRGMIRVVRGPARFPSRQIGARWSGVEIVVMRDIDELCDRLCADPTFKLTKPPENADFSDVGANIHRFFHGRPSCGTHFMFTMAITQPREYAFPAAEADVGHIFSIPLVSADYGKSFGFYKDMLGMIPMLEDHLEGGLWHSTWELPEGLPVELSILKGDAPGLGFGGIELQGYDSSVIDPAPLDPARLDGGSCMGTFTAPDIELVHRTLMANPDATVLSEPKPIPAAPYNGARVFAFLGPGGERIEICEAFD